MATQPVSDVSPAQAASEMRKNVLRLLGYVLGRKLEEGANPSRNSEPAWDSLKHIELMFLLEDEFGVRLSETAMTELEDVHGILRELSKSRRAHHAP